MAENSDTTEDERLVECHALALNTINTCALTSEARLGRCLACPLRAESLSAPKEEGGPDGDE